MESARIIMRYPAISKEARFGFSPKFSGVSFATGNESMA